MIVGHNRIDGIHESRKYDSDLLCIHGIFLSPLFADSDVAIHVAVSRSALMVIVQDVGEG